MQTMELKKKYFNVYLEFDKNKVDSIIENTIRNGGRGYVCSIEANNLSVANQDPFFGEVVNSALVNICDGSVLASILSFLHKENLNKYIGADLFINYVQKKKYRQFFLGNTPEVLEGLRKNLSKIDLAILDMRFETLPFKAVADFDYPAIAAMINQDKPNIIWVSLGAPKQELFMNRLLPFLDQGVLFGFGAIFNFYSGTNTVKRAPGILRKMKLEWLFRAFQEPKKNVPRYWAFIRLLPNLIKEEKAKIKKNN